VLADDHRIVAEGLRSLLEPDFSVIGMVEDGRKLVETALRLRPDLVVTDISMPELSGVDAARQIKAIDRTIRIVFLTMHADSVYATSAREAGASGFVLKHAAPQELLTVMHQAMLDPPFISKSPQAVPGGIRHFHSRNGRETEPGGLSPRQKEVLQLLVEGKSAKIIASILGISSRTVEFHKYRMMEVLQIGTSAELIQHAVRHGLVTL
jgi:DNA-binding NarL/FixJ family response regulator